MGQSSNRRGGRKALSLNNSAMIKSKCVVAGGTPLLRSKGVRRHPTSSGPRRDRMVPKTIEARDGLTDPCEFQESGETAPGLVPFQRDWLVEKSDGRPSGTAG